MRIQVAKAVLVVAALSFLACTTEKIVYRDGSNFAAPATAAASFIGYSDETSKRTVCGGCHVDYQTRWSTTKHASAWKDLQASSGVAGYCEACHSVNNLGNAVTDTIAGYRSTKDARYHDVQCESCHGPGLTHASSPTQLNRPLASIKADTNATDGCGECHTGVHSPFVSEWKLANEKGLSHAIVQSGTVGNTDPTCVGCHTAQGALAQFDPNGNYKEKVATSALTTANALPLVCATCHDPHGSPNEHQLRFSISAANVDDNLCAKCHQRRADPSQVTTRNSVHSPEGPTLFGTAGWFPPGMSTSDSIIGSHGTPSRNPKLCATCHVARFAATDKATGKFIQQSTGHRFIATPCVDANGLPTVAQNCALTAKTFRSCAASSCHASETVARTLYVTDSVRILQLVTSANSAIAKVKAVNAAACTLVAGKPFTSCLGTQFNVSLAQSPGAFVHNPFLLEQLLVASINQIQKDYGVTPDSPPPLTLQFVQPPRDRSANGSRR
ncbi:MAG: cytochrome c3 family protein [Gemmatimonadota bacterium]